MSTRLVTRHKINTTHINKLMADPLYIQILDTLSREDLSFSELAELFPRRSEEQLSHDLNTLVEAGVVARHFRSHAVMYALATHQFAQTIRLLYGLWAERVRLSTSGKSFHF